MINLLFLLIGLHISTVVFSQEMGVVWLKGTPQMEYVTNGVLGESRLVMGKTYDLKTGGYSLAAGTTGVFIVKMPCDVVLKANEDTVFSVDVYDQTSDKPEFPTETRCNEFTLNCSLLTGEIEIINNGIASDKNLFIVNSKLAKFVLSRGKFIIKCTTGHLTFGVVEGNAVVMDNLSKKTHQSKDRDIITISPNTVFIGKASDHAKKQNLISFSQIEPDDYTVLMAGFNEYITKQKPYIFVTENGTNCMVKIRN